MPGYNARVPLLATNMMPWYRVHDTLVRGEYEPAIIIKIMRDRISIGLAILT